MEVELATGIAWGVFALGLVIAALTLFLLKTKDLYIPVFLAGGILAVIIMVYGAITDKDRPVGLMF